MTKWKFTLKSIPLQLLMMALLPMSINRPPPPHPWVFQLKKSKVTVLNSFPVYKVKPTNGKNDALLANVKDVIGD